MATLFPSLISADILNLESTIKKLDPFCDGYHIDSMDNHFVPNLTWGHQFANAIAQATTRQLWVHLMVDDPKSIVKKLSLPHNSIVTFHIENCVDKYALIKHIKKNNWLPSLAINPTTEPHEIMPYMNSVYQILIMSVEPGFSGQAFIPSTISKLEAITQYKTQHNLNVMIGMDGGINATNITELAHKGVDQFGIASGIFNDKDPVENLKELRRLVA